MSDEFCELVLTCDTREQDKVRVKSISDFFEEHGAIVVNEKLERCDYHIEGNYKGAPVNLGIEHKVLTGDFFPSLESMPSKFFQSFKYYTDVALFVEEGNYTIKSTDDGLDAWIQNPAMQNATGQEGVGTLSMYNNFCGSMAEAGVHVRSFRTINHFPVTVSGLLKNIVKPVHRGISIENPDKTFYKDMMNMMAKLPGIGAKRAETGLQYIPNLHWLGCQGLEELQYIFGEVMGKKLYQFIYNHSREEECAKNWDVLYESKAPKRKPETKKKSHKDCVGSTNTPKDNIEHTETQENSPNSILSNPELKYLDDNKPKFIEVPKGQYQNGVQLFDKIIECNICGVGSDCAYVNPKTMLCNACQNNEYFYEEEDKKTLQLSTKASGNLKAQASEIQEIKQPSDNPASQTLAGAGSKSSSADIQTGDTCIKTETQPHKKLGTRDTLQLSVQSGNLGESFLIPTIRNPQNQTLPEPNIKEKELWPHLRDVLEYIRQKERNTEEVEQYFSFTKTYCFDLLYNLKKDNKIWYNGHIKKWEYGRDKSPSPVVADKEMDIGVD